MVVEAVVEAVAKISRRHARAARRNLSRARSVRRARRGT